jgi:hypothetical protein
VDAGRDLDGNGALSADEITSSQQVCHGDDSLIGVTTLASDPDVCPNGGGLMPITSL